MRKWYDEVKKSDDIQMKKLSQGKLNKLRNKFNHDISDDYIKFVVKKNSNKYKKFQHEVISLL